jgi:hypothetical protein
MTELPIQDGDTVQPVEREGTRRVLAPAFTVHYQELSPELNWKLYDRDPSDPDFDPGDYWLEADCEIVQRAENP